MRFQIGDLVRVTGRYKHRDIRLPMAIGKITGTGKSFDWRIRFEDLYAEARCPASRYDWPFNECDMEQADGPW